MNIIKNGDQLDNLLATVANTMLIQARDKIYEEIKKSIDMYYLEYSPSKYKRSYKFLKSLVKTQIVQKKNELYCEVKISEDYLDYAYPYPNDFHPSYPQEYEGNGRLAQGIDIVNWANRQFPDDDEPGGNHGYTVDAGREDGFWDGTLEELGDIILILKDNLRKQGLKVV